MGFLDNILKTRQRTLLVLTEADVLAMSAGQKREYNRNSDYAVMLQTNHPEPQQQLMGLELAGQFQSLRRLCALIGKWDPQPQRILLSSQFLQAGFMERELTKAFLDIDTEIHDFSAARGRA